MSDLPHVIVGDHPTGEHIRVMEAYMREEDWTVPPTAWAGRRLTVADYNAAVDWWNGLQASPAAGLYCLDPECDCRKARDEERTP